MSEIIQLPPEVADQISAGEVIERPASVVKELVENSIDAGSGRIIVEVDNGGKDKIWVRDNGSGIRGKELKLAFSRYATSKIQGIDDLYSLQTLGFRGEALASISSVSQIEVTTKIKDSQKGNYIKIRGGEIIEERPTGCPVGTDIRVQDLFYNTPARYKYMKTTTTEFGHISDVINREALAYPEIQFILSHNNKQVLSTPGTGNLKDCIYSLYGRELTAKLIPVDFEDRYIKVSGLIAHPDYYRSSRVHELFFVNRRPVQSLILNQGIEEGYRGLIPRSRYPVIFLFLELNPVIIDVNVHPTKKEVKFSRNQIIKEVIAQGIKEVLQSRDFSSRIKIKNNSDTLESKDKKKYDQLKLANKDNKLEDTGYQQDVKAQSPAKKNNINNEQTYYEEHTNSKEHVKVSEFNKIKEDKSEDKSYESKQNSHKKKPDKIEQPERKQDKDESTNRQNSGFIFNISNKDLPVKKIVGQSHNSYIIAEGKDGLYIFDQHAAHERILYEEFYSKYNKNRVITQPLLVPVNIELTVSEMEVLKKYMNELNNLGFRLEAFGSRSYIIREVPLTLKNKSNKSIVREIIDKLIDEGKTMDKAELIKQVITYMSCRGAIMAGEKLETSEMEKIIIDLYRTENPFRCPHGRPTIIQLTDNELKKGFKRK